MAGSRYQRLPVTALNQFCVPPGSGHALLVGVNSCFRPEAEISVSNTHCWFFHGLSHLEQKQVIEA